MEEVLVWGVKVQAEAGLADQQVWEHFLMESLLEERCEGVALRGQRLRYQYRSYSGPLYLPAAGRAAALTKHHFCFKGTKIAM